ncbi:MAG: GPP34 family phosphoprotein [Mycobacterium sp.]
MARIAEDLLLLLLDNPSAQAQLDRPQLTRVLATALILDLAYDCRVRPALPTDPLPAGLLVALAGPVPLDPAVRPALAVLNQGPITPAAAIAKVRKHAEDDVLDQLLRTGQIHQVGLSKHRLRRNTYAWPVKNRIRVDAIRGAVQSALSGQHSPDAATTAITSLLYLGGGLQAALNLSDEGVRRAGEIASGPWANDSSTAEVNLALTAATVLPALVG